MFEALTVSFKVHMHTTTISILNQGLVKQTFSFLDYLIFMPATKNYSGLTSIVLPNT